MPPNIFNIRYMKSQMIHSLTWNKMSIFKEISKTFCFLSLQHFLFIPYFPAYSSSFSLILFFFFFKSMISLQGFPRWLSGKESAWQCRRCRRRGFNLWIRKIPWSKKWQPALVFLPGKFHGQRSLVGYSPWGCKESDTPQRLNARVHTDKKTDRLTHKHIAYCWGPAWGTPPMAKVMRKEAWHTQRRDRASGVPLEILEHLPP